MKKQINEKPMGREQERQTKPEACIKSGLRAGYDNYYSILDISAK